MLAALLENMGVKIMHVLHAADTEEALHEAFATLLAECDLVITVGGVSVGEKDLVKPVIEQLGGTLDLWRVRMKPGKPVALARAGNKPIVCLPGNPVSSFVVFVMLVSPLVRMMQGRDDILPPVHYGKLSTTTTYRETREEFIRVRALPATDGSTALEPYPLQGSGIISSLPWSSGLARIPVNTLVGNGDIVAYYSWAHWLA
jgi:molybdopterin molybdotransferase